MQDNFGRSIDYLRVSITDRCNLRCLYCMPEQGVALTGHDQVLRFEEILRVCRVMTALGVDKLKISGGEPLARRDAVTLIAAAKQLPGIRQVTLTTNGQLLAEQLPGLVGAGLDGINISLDTLDPARYRQITRRGELQPVLRSLELALDSGVPVKLNAVLLRGVNDDEIPALAALARERRLPVRFIELMPIGRGAAFAGVSGTEVLHVLQERYGAPQRLTERLGNGPAVYYRFPGFAAPIGLISALSDRFCDRCNRVRLTADGQLKLCLHYDTGVDLRPLLRREDDDAVIARAIVETLRQKPAAHCFGMEQGDHIEAKNMNAIGG